MQSITSRLDDEHAACTWGLGDIYASLNQKGMQFKRAPAQLEIQVNDD